MKANINKYHLLVTAKTIASVNIEENIKNSNEQKILGIKQRPSILLKIMFHLLAKRHAHVHAKLYVLEKTMNYINLNKHKCFMKVSDTCSSIFDVCFTPWN